MMANMTADDGSRRRDLLQGPAGELFRDVVQAGVLPRDDPRALDGRGPSEALTLLVELGLLRDDPATGGWVAVDPALVQPGVVAPLGRQVVQLLDESAAWADVLGGLGQVFRRTPRGDSALNEIRGLPSINRFLEAAVDDAEHELLAAQPAGARRAAVLEQAVDRDIRALQRGVRMRTLYQHTARRSKATREHVARTMEHGAQVRTLDEFFNRLIVIDRRLAVIPGDQPDLALAVHDSGIVSYLADVFDRSWERAHDYEERGEASESDIASEVRQLTVRMLTEGHSDPASAKRVGVSTRTYASYVAALKEEYGVETRFQLGYAMGTRTANDGTRETTREAGPPPQK
jgi:hypothetical protein